MIELALHDELDELFSENLPSGAIRLHLGLNHNWDDLSARFGDELDSGQLQIARGLLADDNAARHFERVGDALIIRVA